MRAFILLLLACAFNTAHAEEFTAKVIAVLDGDTVLVKRAGGLVKIRLAEIDAPEKSQEHGMDSKQSLSDLVLDKQVNVNSRAVDDYGRMVAHLTANGRSVNEEQVRRGMAWEYSNYHSNKVYLALQDEAQNAKRGLWAQASPTPPWQWRKAHPATQAPPHATAQGYSCGSKRHCSQMASCNEAHFYLTHCGMKSLDKNGNGVPCESLCAANSNPQ
ncbi:MAG: thermonuclease family protein [Gallionellaceae bacterium]|nr:thermonuclease family protein [Gallionellaceae bacterium]